MCHFGSSLSATMARSVAFSFLSVAQLVAQVHVVDPEIPADFNPAATIGIMGRGYNSVTAQIAGDCMAPSALVTENAAQQVTYSVDFVQTNEELRRALNASAAVSFGMGIFSGSAAAHYFSSKSVNHYGAALLLREVITSRKEVMRSLNLQRDRTRQLERAPSLFEQGCGNSFISGVEYGGEFDVVLSSEAHSESELVEIEAQMKASVGVYGSLSGNLQSELSRLSSRYHLQVQLVRYGASGNLPNVQSIPDLIAYAQSFPSEVAKSQTLTRALLSPYTVAANLSKHARENYYDGANQALKLNALARVANEAQTEIADIDFMIANEGSFPISSLHTLQNERVSLEASLAAARERARTCSLTAGSNGGCARAEAPRLEVVDILPFISWIPIAVRSNTDQACHSVAAGDDYYGLLKGSWNSGGAGANDSHYVSTHVNPPSGGSYDGGLLGPIPRKLPDNAQTCVYISDNIPQDNFCGQNNTDCPFVAYYPAPEQLNKEIDRRATEIRSSTPR